MRFYPVGQGNLPRLILCVKACRRERQGRTRPPFSVYFCVLYAHMCWSCSNLTSDLFTQGTLARFSCSQCKVTVERMIPLWLGLACPPWYEKADGSSLLPCRTHVCFLQMSEQSQQSVAERTQIHKEIPKTKAKCQ